MVVLPDVVVVIMAFAYGKDVDIMGIQRGEHVDGASVCEHYVFKVPGGKNPDGTALFGWNDIGAAYCARCGHRDTAHVILKDLPDAEEELRRLMIQRQAQKPHPLAATLEEPTGTQMSGARVPVRVATTRAVPTGTGTTGAEAGPLAQPSPLQMYELEPGVADPLAASAYAYARAQHEEQKAARMRAAVEEAREERAAVEKVGYPSPSRLALPRQGEPSLWRSVWVEGQRSAHCALASLPSHTLWS